MSPTIFKIVVGTVVRATLLVLCVPQEDHNGLGCAVGEQYIVFYSDHVRISGRNPIWVQGTLTTLVRMFEWLWLYTNLGKTNYVTCMTGFV